MSSTNNVLPTTLNQMASNVSVTEVVLNYDLATADYSIDIPDNTIVEKVVAYPEVAFAGGNPTVKIGDGSDDDAFLANADFTYGTAGAVANSAFVGITHDAGAAGAGNAFSEGRAYPSGGSVVIDWAKNGSSTAGRLVVLVYSRTSNR